MRLSRPKISTPGIKWSNSTAMAPPTNPQMPVIRSRIGGTASHTRGRGGWGRRGRPRSRAGHGRRPLLPRPNDLGDDLRQALANRPGRVMGLHLALVAVVTDVIADTV